MFTILITDNCMFVSTMHEIHNLLKDIIVLYSDKVEV